jgi:hypothetical protein
MGKTRMGIRPASPHAASPSSEHRCPACRAQVSSTARFCGACGQALTHSAAPLPSRRETAVRPRPPLPPSIPPPRRPARWSLTARVAQPSVSSGRTRVLRCMPVSCGAMALLAGGLACLIGCFMPLAAGAGGGISVIPDVTARFAGALWVPLSGALLLNLGGLVLVGVHQRWPWVGGLAVALASPGLAMTLVFIATASRFMPSAAVSQQREHIGLSVGAVLLLVGFLVCLTGAFTILANASEAGKERSAG